ncbi:MAG: CHAT domain-containing protein [Gammaproteobacteria bacterium]|nr:CHAT domain-containing protein [Gammaproteobacteria bacterium]
MLMILKYSGVNTRYHTIMNRPEFLQKPYHIVHLATHARFYADPTKTFILTHDGKLDLQRLEQLLRAGRFHSTPVDLMMFSACETAKGNERAALGLGGVTVKTGVKSALASLWKVDDKATAELSTAFYRHLRNYPHLNKAQALQQAQQELLKYPEYRHPAFWAGFLLIGNWL